MVKSLWPRFWPTLYLESSLLALGAGRGGQGTSVSTLPKVPTCWMVDVTVKKRLSLHDFPLSGTSLDISGCLHFCNYFQFCKSTYSPTSMTYYTCLPITAHFPPFRASFSTPVSKFGFVILMPVWHPRLKMERQLFFLTSASDYGLLTPFIGIFVWFRSFEVRSTCEANLAGLQYQSRDWLWRPPLKWPILCRVGR